MHDCTQTQDAAMQQNYIPTASSSVSPCSCLYSQEQSILFLRDFPYSGLSLPTTSTTVSIICSQQLF